MPFGKRCRIMGRVVMQTPPKTNESVIEFSVRVVENGEAKFESSISQPLFASPERQKATTEAWMELMAAGLRMSQLLRDEAPTQVEP